MAVVDAGTAAKLVELGWVAVASSVTQKRGTKNVLQTTLCDKGVLYWSWEAGAFTASPFA